MKPSLLLILVLTYSYLFAQNQTINAIIGDTSWVATFDKQPTTNENEAERIKTHLNYVVKRLKQSTPPDDLALKIKRTYHIQLLEEYIQLEAFPKNTQYQNQRRPCFIDDEGKICAVGYLIEQSQGRAAAEKISSNYQYHFLTDINNSHLTTWQQSSGLSMKELAMIQPAYNYRGPKWESFYNRETQKYGVKNRKTGAVVIRAKYDALTLNIYGKDRNLGRARKQDKWGLINSKGKLISKLKYDRINGRTYVFAYKDSMLNIYSGTGRIEYTFKYAKAARYSAPYFEIQIGEKWGIFHPDGFWKVQPRYKNIDHVRYKSIRGFKAETNEGWGFVNDTGRVIVPFQYKELDLLGYTWYARTETESFLYDSDGNLGNLRGIEEIKPYGYYNSFSSNIMLARMGNKYGLIDGSRSWILLPMYDEINKNLELHYTRLGKYNGCYDYKGREILPTIYDSFYRRSIYHGPKGKADFFVVQLNGKYGLADEAGKLKIQPEYDTLILINDGYYSSDNFCLAALKSGQWKLLSNDGTLLYQEEFEDFKELSKYTFLVKNDSSYFIGRYFQNQVSIYRKKSFQGIKVLGYTANKKGLFAAQRSGGYELWEMYGEDWSTGLRRLKTTLFEDVLQTPFAERYLVKQKGKYGIIDGQGKYIFSLEYSDYQFFENPFSYNHMLLKKENEWYTVTPKNGNIRKGREESMPVRVEPIKIKDVKGMRKRKYRETIGTME